MTPARIIVLVASPFIAFATLYSLDQGCFICLDADGLSESERRIDEIVLNLLFIAGFICVLVRVWREGRP